MSVNVIELRNNFKKPHRLLTTTDNKILFLREWNPPTPSNAAILILHGITGYSELYDQPLATPLSKANFSVFGLDLRGHGLSDGKRGDYKSKERVIKDLCETISFLHKEYDQVIILGHSLGVLSSTIAINNCLGIIDGLVLLSAARKPREGVYKKMSVWLKLKILLSSIIFPSKPVARYYREGVSGLDDPLRNFNYTLRFLKIFDAKTSTFPEDLNIPTLVGIGDQDELFEVDSARAMYNEIPSKKKSFIVIEGAKHAEFPEGCWKDLIEWLRTNFK